MANATIPTRLLVIGMTDGQGVVQADRLFNVARACGQTDEQVRSCLRRMISERVFVREGRGRKARYVPTARGREELRVSSERAQRAFTQDAHSLSANPAGTWDGRWRLIGFEVPEALRADRDEFRSTLISSFGAAGLQSGLYVTPHPCREVVAGTIDRLSLSKHTFFATTDELVVHGETDARKIARVLWPVDDLARRYRHLNDQFRAVVERTRDLQEKGQRLPAERLLPGTLRMAVSFMDVHYNDPLLPPELLPQPWPGREARALVREARRRALDLRSDPTEEILFSFFDDVVVDRTRA